MGARTATKAKDKSHWTILLIALLALAFVMGGRWYLMSSHQQATGPVGGPFTLVDHTGHVRSDKDFLGSYTLIYFGYTHCPDVCPISLQSANDVLDMLPEDLASQIVPIMISVDPERDTPQRMAEYIDNFHPRTVGLTGTKEQVLAVSETFRIVAQKTGEEDAYLVDHTSMFFLTGPDGVYIDRFSSLAKPEAIAARIEELMKQNVPSKPA